MHLNNVPLKLILHSRIYDISYCVHFGNLISRVKICTDVIQLQFLILMTKYLAISPTYNFEGLLV